MKTRALWLCIIAGSLLSSACTSTGTGTGQLVTPAGKRDAVTFRWRSDAGDWHHGTISVTLPTGEHYTGTYRQVSHSAPVGLYTSMWTGWDPFWPDWPPPWYRGTVVGGWEGWVRVYEGRVVARLEASAPARAMRCRFTLDDPDRGLAGGGDGDCKLSDGSAIRDAELVPDEDAD